MNTEIRIILYPSTHKLSRREMWSCWIKHKAEILTGSHDLFWRTKATGGYTHLLYRMPVNENYCIVLPAVVCCWKWYICNWEIQTIEAKLDNSPWQPGCKSLLSFSVCACARACAHISLSVLERNVTKSFIFLFVYYNFLKLFYVRKRLIIFVNIYVESVFYFLFRFVPNPNVIWRCVPVPCLFFVFM